MIKIERLMVIIAHPDDEVLGCAGLICHLIKNKKQVHVLYLNQGNTFNNNVEDVKEQSAKVCEYFGCSFDMENYDTARFNEYSDVELNNCIKKHVEKFKPDAVITHIANDLHKDHQVVSNAVMICSRYMPNSTIKHVLTMPIISSSEINPSFDFTPNLFLDIGDYILNKINAMQFYSVEYEKFKELRGEDGIKGWGRFYGMHINVQYAEGYKLIRSVF